MSDNERTNDSLRMLQALPLNLKVSMTQARIRAWYQNFDGKVYCSFSGGKDSTVQLDIVRSMYPEVKAVFSNTGLEYPEIQHFAKSFDNVDVVTPKLRFNEVVSTYGYPLISKEVAQAIYYARRIVKSDRPEREYDQYSNCWECIQGAETYPAGQTQIRRDSLSNLESTHETIFRRAELLGIRDQSREKTFNYIEKKKNCIPQ